MPHEVPPLPYDYDALEPYLDSATMRIHHDKHHQAYADKTHTALVKYPELHGRDLQELIYQAEELLPPDIRQAVINNGGGYLNHNFYWTCLAKPANEENLPIGELAKEIDREFGGYENFKTQFKDKALAVFGSGWTWLVVNSAGQLEIVNTANQTLLSRSQRPLFTIDVWEHAYYLKYQNRRTEFIDAFFHVIDWAKAEKRFQEVGELL